MSKKPYWNTKIIIFAIQIWTISIEITWNGKRHDI